MKLTASALISSLLLAGATLSASAAEVNPNLPPEFDPALSGGVPGWVVGNVRQNTNKAKDVNQHPFMMMVIFGRLTNRMTAVELMATDRYWSEWLGGALAAGNGRGRYIQVADPADKPNWTQLNEDKKVLLQDYQERIELVPLNPDSLIEPGTADFVFMSKKMGKLMAGGTLDKVVASTFKALKPGGTFLVEDYRAANDKPQDPKAASGYIREDYAVAQIEKAGFKFAAKNDALFSNPADTRAALADNSDRFLLRFTK